MIIIIYYYYLVTYVQLHTIHICYL